jgi:hypothetical protein
MTIFCNSSVLAGTGEPQTLQICRGSNLHKDNDGRANCRPVSSDLLYTTLDTWWAQLLVIGSGQFQDKSRKPKSDPLPKTSYWKTQTLHRFQCLKESSWTFLERSSFRFYIFRWGPILMHYSLYNTTIAQPPILSCIVSNWTWFPIGSSLNFLRNLIRNGIQGSIAWMTNRYFIN